jgi:hypothetical protein
MRSQYCLFLSARRRKKMFTPMPVFSSFRLRAKSLSPNRRRHSLCTRIVFFFLNKGKLKNNSCKHECSCSFSDFRVAAISGCCRASQKRSHYYFSWCYLKKGRGRGSCKLGSDKTSPISSITHETLKLIFPGVC